MVFDESIIKNRVWRDKLNRILLDPDARDQSRLFLVCFCKDQLEWDIEKIVWFLSYYGKWSDFKEKETRRQVANIFRRADLGLLKGKGYHANRSQASHTDKSETRHEWKPTAKEKYSHEENRCQAHEEAFLFPNLDCCGFLGFTSVGDEEKPKDMKDIKVFGEINNGNRFYRIVEKEGQYGSFLSLDSGQLMDAFYEGKTIQAKGRPDKFFNLPKEPEVLKEIIEALQKTLPTTIKKK